MLSDNVSARLNDLTLKNNIPVVVTVELTRRCPLACAHCYLPETRADAGRKRQRELSAAQWKKILKRLAEAGSIYLVFTGGEPLLRPDLAELCFYAKKMNFDVKVYSSGLGMSRSLAGRLKKAGVSAFEISLYGREPVHDAITGLKGSFKRSLLAVTALKKAGIAVKLKTPLMKLNFKERGWLSRLAEKRGFSSGFDPVLAPGNDGSTSNLKYRLNKRQLETAINDGSLSGDLWRPADNRRRSSTGLDFFCGAGRNVAGLDPYGNLNPCLQIPVNIGNALKGTVKNIWKSSPWLKKWRAFKNSDLKECRDCRYLTACNRCPGISLLEKGSLLAPNSIACEMAGIIHRQAV
ncbi:MAG: hypothetical protein A2270_06305 [Elusimicrobia bacterium RIFOXYA12_FULL_51_18]|nr:MAG: hypothetical protein A2270_06305 [Elusimicrobia bacterium RIFOXYA12_FULL_51_18]OGS29813.1 MAG: hypothetical protein A2218_03375 [Elusimicrobia bacterium RIFOXYA2_FULL_53_38]